MNLSTLHPLNKLITDLSQKKGDTINFDELKQELSRTNDNDEKYYYINFKEQEDLCIIYYDNIQTESKSHTEEATELEHWTRSCILDKSTMTLVASQFNKILYNDEAEEIIKNSNWDNIVINACHEGTMLLVFNHNDTWYVSTRRCLDAGKSKWIRNKSYREMFNETIEGKFSLDDLDTNNVYYFILVHYKNRNIIDNTRYGDYYKNVIHVMTTEKYTMNEVDYTINENVTKSELLNYSSLEEVQNSLVNISQNDEINKSVSSEGYILRVYEGEVGKSRFQSLKLQTSIYQTLMKMKPNNSNLHQIYLELYQKDLLYEFLPYFTKYSNDVIRRINGSMKTMSKEILDLYHKTRNKKNNDIYNNLKDQYKKVIYELHGQYIRNRGKDFVDGIEKPQDEQRSKPVRVHDVYHYLKLLSSQNLRKLYYERTLMLDDGTLLDILNKNCMNTRVQTTLMFKDMIKKTYQPKHNQTQLSQLT